MFLILYTYLFYPVLLIILDGLLRHKNYALSDEKPGISIIIAAYNEEKVIEDRIKNCLDLVYPQESMEIIIVSDGSDDKTNEIVSKYKNQGVVLREFEGRRGKVNVLNEIVPEAKYNIVILSDANTMFAKDAAKMIVRYFADQRIGCVCGRLHFISAEQSNSGELEGFYWRYETFLKKLEGKQGSLLGANGGIFAIRKELFVKCPADTIVEDFVLPMEILKNGHDVVYAPEAVAVEESAKHIIQEKQRRVRIGAGDYQALFRLLPMLNPMKGYPALAFFSHKVLRWFVPFLMIIVFITNLFLIQRPFYACIFLAQCMFYVFAVFGQVLSWAGHSIKFFNLCYYFVSMNVALFLGFFRYLTGAQKVTWIRTER